MATESVVRSQSRTQDVTRAFLNQVYLWMTVGLLITGWVSATVVQNPAMVVAIHGNPFLFWGMIIAWFLMAVFLIPRALQLSAAAGTAAFLIFSALTGLVISDVFLVYTSASIALTFYITAGTFGGMSLWGYTTKQDLTSIGNICGMAVWGIIIASVVNIFFRSPALYWMSTYIGVAAFTGLIAYHTQRLKQIPAQATDDESLYKMAILGALILYLNFVNLFLLFLRIFGRRR